MTSPTTAPVDIYVGEAFEQASADQTASLARTLQASGASPVGLSAASTEAGAVRTSSGRARELA